MLVACGGQEAEKTTPPPATTPPAAKPATPPAAAPAAKPAAPAKGAHKSNPVTQERQAGTLALRDADVRTALALTPDQTAKLEKLGSGSFNIGMNQADMVYAVLTPEQHAKLQQEMVKRAGPQALSLLWVQAALGLDDTQRAKLSLIYQTQAAAVRKVAARADANDQQKGEEIAKLVVNVEAAGMAVLTPEQKTKLDALKGGAAS